MSIKTMSIAALLGGIVIFLWGVVVHLFLIPEPTKAFKDSVAVMAFVDAQAPANGAYTDPHGAFMTVARIPGNADKGPLMGQMLGYEFLTNVLQAVILAWLLMRSTSSTVMGDARYAAMIAMLAFVAIDLSNWNWYGFPPILTMQSMVDGVGSGFLAGAVIGWCRKRWPATR